MKRRPILLALLAVVACAAQTEAPIPFPDWKALKFPALRSPVIPKPEEFTLPNGMRVYLLEDHELPLVSGTALVRVGNLFDPADKVGLADITGAVIRSGGTKELTGDQIDVQLENVAASVESGIAESSGTVSFSCLKENTGLTLGLFHDVLTSPEFRQDKIDLIRTQYRSSIARRNDDPGSIANREFANTIYGHGTPYGWMPEYATLDNITRDDVMGFYKRYYFPANVMLAVIGDFNSAEMRDRLTRLFADWTYKQPPAPKFPEVVRADTAGTWLAAKSDVNQTFFEVGHLGGLLSDKDYAALDVAADILGGGLESRLMRRIRTKLGYAYGVYSSWGANYDHPGLFEISGSTQSKYTVATLKAVREEIEGMRTAEVTDDELRTARDKVENSFVFLFDKPEKTLGRIVRYDYYGYPRDFIFRFQKAVQTVTKADILRVCKQYWDPRRLTIVAVGNPSGFGEPLSGLGVPVKPIDLTIPPPQSK
ncbi:MAG TPA: pitrilysin family protein [Bryobacteraceae bacterium]|nr:pitrilysin family protein [Bryobacteraceae bacterium]